MLFTAWGLVLSSCSKDGGPSIAGCVVNAPKLGFDCSTQNENYFIQLKYGQELKCVSPAGLEAFVKACKRHELMPLVLCHYSQGNDLFLCQEDPSGVVFPSVPVAGADNYFCVSPKDLERIKARCR
jgi:hypothetical protein